MLLLLLHVVSSAEGRFSLAAASLSAGPSCRTAADWEVWAAAGARRKLVELYDAPVMSQVRRRLQQSGYFPIQFILVFASPEAASTGASTAVAVSTSPSFVVRVLLCICAAEPHLSQSGHASFLACSCARCTVQLHLKGRCCRVLLLDQAFHYQMW